MKRVIFMAMLIGLVQLTSCSNALDKQYNTETTEADLKEIGEQLDSTSMKHLTMGMFKYALQPGELRNKTYRELMEEGKLMEEARKEEQRKQAELAEKVRKEEEERVARLSEALTVAVLEKDFIEYDYQEYNAFKLAFENTSGKDIRAFKGMIEFTDLFDETVKNMEFTYDKPIPAGQSVTWDAYMKYNQFIDSDGALRSKKLEDLKVNWKPEKFIFADGSTLE